MIIKRYRSLIKAVSWRIVGSLDTFFISFLLTGKAHLAIGISGIECLTKIFLYYCHERVWNKISLGKE